MRSAAAMGFCPDIGRRGDDDDDGGGDCWLFEAVWSKSQIHKMNWQTQTIIHLAVLQKSCEDTSNYFQKLRKHGDFSRVLG